MTVRKCQNMRLCLLAIVFICVIAFVIFKKLEYPENSKILYPKDSEVFTQTCSDSMSASDIDHYIDQVSPVIYFITPTYARREQIADLTRLSQTLLHIKECAIPRLSSSRLPTIRPFYSVCTTNGPIHNWYI